MNLHAIVQGAIGVVNPPTMCSLQVSAGYNTAPDGIQTPNYLSAVSVPVDVQALTSGDLRRMDGLNQQGTHRACYLNGNVEGIDRSAIKGGDLLTMPNLPDFPGPTTWLVTEQPEHWPGWTKIIVTLQLPQ